MPDREAAIRRQPDRPAGRAPAGGRELAVRLAVGATPRRVGVMVLGENARLALAGIAIGLAGAWGLSTGLFTARDLR